MHTWDAEPYCRASPATYAVHAVKTEEGTRRLASRPLTPTVAAEWPVVPVQKRTAGVPVPSFPPSAVVLSYIRLYAEHFGFMVELLHYAQGTADR